MKTPSFHLNSIFTASNVQGSKINTMKAFLYSGEINTMQTTWKACPRLMHLTSKWYTRIAWLWPCPVVVVQSLSHVWLFGTPWTAAHQASLSFTISQGLFKLMSIELVMPSNHLILWRPLLLLPSIFPSIRVFSNESVIHIRWPKYCRVSFSISPFNDYSGLISFRIDLFDLAVQGTLFSVHSSKASVLQHSAFFMVQFLYPYITTGKIKTLTR